MKDVEMHQSNTERTESPKQSRQEVLDESMEALQSLIGLSEIKNEINLLMLELKGLEKIEALGKQQVKKPMRHMMFSGDAGTGKTEIARIFADILYGIGFIKEHKFIEVDRSDIVGQYIGQTEANMKEILGRAKGGVLFIDEAYALAGEGNDFGAEAINVLIKAMEDERDNLVIILAGYRSDMKQLLKMNDGFNSRIPYKFEFPSYTPEELTHIVVRILRSQGFECIDALIDIKKAVMMAGKSGSIEGNARWARTFAERIAKHHYIRIAKNENQSAGTITSEDINSALGLTVGKDPLAQAGLLKIRDEAMAELDALIGLAELKQETKRILNFVAMEKRREAAGLKTEMVGMHMIFAGPPGTGKTTVARIIGKFLYGVGFLPSSTFIEADRSTIVGKYIGQTEDKMTKLIDKADGGVLFIDEAYALAAQGGNDFGVQAVNLLIKAMEDKRDRLVVILAGYEDEMEHLLMLNPGFKSRIPYHLSFPSYSPIELVEITQKLLHSFSFELTPKAALHLEKHIKDACHAGRVEGNARWARNLVDQIRLEQNNRLAEENSNAFSEITEQDILSAFSRMR